MAFKDLEYKIGPGTAAGVCSMSYKRYGTKKKRPPRLKITITKSIVDKAKLKAPQLFRLLLGEGNDAGLARISPVAAGGVKPNSLRGSMTFNFGFVPMLGEDAAEREEIDVSVIGNGVLQIKLPPWFKPDVVDVPSVLDRKKGKAA